MERGNVVGSAGALAHWHLRLRSRVRAMLSELLFSASASMLGCVYLCQAQRSVSAVRCRVGCALVIDERSL